MNKTGKRQYRELDDVTKKKISQALTGRVKSFSHRENIKNGLIKYWKTIPNKHVENN